ncbi:tautomerase family protein [Caballeronia sp. LZ062]|nr:tautomerase family protein [Caballeronia sp. LZ062]MDR5856739.1 tautomerase family protein [Caballeronia sp. LZ050]MDR5869864.1 tautomerase family protein [Caballeronia sp. LZ062]
MRGKDAAYRAVIGDVVYENARFQIGGEHRASDFIVDCGYLGISRTDHCIVIQVTLNEGRDGVKKRAFCRAVADGLHERIRLRR